VGSLITLADKPLYGHYGTAPEAFGVSALADQQLGGLLMWVIGGTFWLVILTVIFFVWADREQHDAYA
jgi:cytochrome c oxidase assembly factor CtaG